MPRLPNNPSYPALTIVGIDPGASGGFAIMEGTTVTLTPMPETERDVWYILRDIADPTITLHPVKVAIEWINPGIPRIGKSSMSKLYGSYMSLRMALTAAGLPYEIITPKKWQAGLDILPRKKEEKTDKWKARLKQVAQQMFPKIEGINKATADALLIAEYYRRTLK